MGPAATSRERIPNLAVAGFYLPLLGLFFYAAIPAGYAISRLVNNNGNVRTP